MMKNNVYGIIFLIVSMLLVAGCTNLPPTVPGKVSSFESGSFDNTKDVVVKQFTSEDELNSFVKQFSVTNNYYRDGIMLNSAEGAMVKFVSPSANSGIAKSSDSSVSSKPTSDFSKTNVQVENVDEADIIKTDGNYIYTVSGNVLFIIKAYPGENASIISSIKFDGNPESLFIEGDYVAVFGNYYNEAYFKTLNFVPRKGMTFLNIYDVKDKEKPVLVKDYKVEGNYFNGRLKDGYMYLLTTMYNNDHPIPILFDGGVRKMMPISDIYYFNIPYNSPVFVNIHSINLTNPSEEIQSKSVAVEGNQNLYMSEKNIFVTYTEYVNEYQIEQQIVMDLLSPKLSDAENALISKIKVVDEDVLSKGEKDAKIYSVYQDHVNLFDSKEQELLQDDIDSLLKKKLEELKFMEFTVINKISVDKGNINFVANGKVPGRISNQFSLDEKDDVLRIATTIDARWSRFGESTKSNNNVYSLDSNLKLLGSLEGLAEDEQIYSTRFISDRLYMVTFRQVDPFFVIDLSNPKEIKELGKLKIPGFSKYLHPYDDNIIIGIGKEASDTGRVKGLKISLFDVSDVSNPKEIAKYYSGDKYADSNVLYEHKAFLFSKDKNLLVIPAYNYDYEDKTNNYNGAMVFEIKKDSITLRGLIDHSQGGTDQYWQPSVERSLYINELLYTKSLNLLRINKIEDLSKVKNVELNYSNPDIKIY